MPPDHIYQSATNPAKDEQVLLFCIAIQYNTKVLVLVLQYYFGKFAILKQYQKISPRKVCVLLMRAF